MGVWNLKAYLEEVMVSSLVREYLNLKIGIEWIILPNLSPMELGQSTTPR